MVNMEKHRADVTLFYGVPFHDVIVIDIECQVYGRYEILCPQFKSVNLVLAIISVIYAHQRSVHTYVLRVVDCLHLPLVRHRLWG